MSFRCAIPNNPFYLPLIANAEPVCRQLGISLHVGSEQECLDMFIAQDVDVALLTPAGYGSAADTVGCSVVSTAALTLSGFTQSATIYLRAGDDNAMQTCASTSAEDFLIQAGVSALSEKFDVSLECQQVDKPLEELLQEFDVVIEWGYDEQHPITLDVSDEWLDSHKKPLPASLWVCQGDAVPENIEEILSSMVHSENPDEYHIAEEEHHGVNAEREGKILYAWNDDFEDALAHTLETLFYMQITPSIAPLRVHGREEVANTMSTAEISLPNPEDSSSQSSSETPPEQDLPSDNGSDDELHDNPDDDLTYRV